MSKRMVSLFLSAVMFVVCSFGATATYAAENIETAIIDGKEYRCESRIVDDKEYMYITNITDCLLYTSPSPRDGLLSRMPSSA